MRRIRILIALAVLTCTAHAQDRQWISVPPQGLSSYFMTGVGLAGSKGVAVGWAAGQKAAILTTADSGRTWTPSGIDGMLLQGAQMMDPQNALVVGYKYDCKCGVIMKTSDGGKTWGLGTTPAGQGFGSISFLNKLTGFIAGAGGEVLKTTDGGVNWTALPPINGGVSKIFFVDPNRGYALSPGAGGRPSRLFRTTDGGNTWTMPQDYGSTRVLGDIYFTTPTTGVMVGMDHGMAIYRTTDAGDNWTRQYTGPDGDEQLLNAVTFTDASHGYAVGNNGVALRTKDGGISWQSEETGTALTLSAVHFVSPTVGVAVGTPGAMVRRVDLAAGEVPVLDIDGSLLEFGSVPIGGKKQASFFLRPGSHAELVLDSIYIKGSASAKQQFKIVSPARSEFPISLEGDTALKVIVECSPTGKGSITADATVVSNDQTRNERSVELTANGVAGVEDYRAVERELELLPNPIGSSGLVRVDVPAREHLSLTLVDLLGRTVAIVFDGVVEPGAHQFTLDARTLPAGAYACVMRGAGKEVSKLIRVVH